jgi:acyl-CoA synthetase (NDP forming)
MDTEERNVLIERFFYPKSIAVIGVSSNEKAFTTLYLYALMKFGYKGKIYPVNPRGGTIYGLQMFPSIREIPDSVDLAIVGVPGKAVPSTLEDCLAKGIQAAIVLSAGFSEAGDEGKKLQKEMNIVIAKGIHVIGPNCFGIYCPSGGITVKPGDNFPKESGPVALITQSGLFTEMIVLQSRGMGIRFSKVISYGNASDLNEADFLELLADDPDTKVITCYIEGVKDGRRFLEAVRRAVKIKPVLIWKAGQTEIGRAAAGSHTGSLGGSEAIWNTFFAQSGAVRIDSIETLIDNAIAFLHLMPNCGRRVALVSGSGGVAVTGADICERSGFTLPAFSIDLQQKIRSFLPPVIAGLRNPFDLADPFPPAEVLTPVLETIAGSGLIDTLILQRIFLSVKGPRFVFGTLPVPEEGREKLKEIPVSIRDRFNIPVVMVLNEELSDDDKIEFETDRRLLRSFYLAKGLPVYPTVERAVKALANVVKYKERFHKEVGPGGQS